MKVSLNKVLQAFLSIRNMQQAKCSNKWAYAITKNKAKMQSDIDGIAKSEEKFMAITKEQNKYVQDFGDVDKNGQKVVAEDDAGILEIQERFIKEYEAHSELLKTEVEIDLAMISFEEVPKEISQLDFENLSIMIAEPK